MVSVNEKRQETAISEEIKLNVKAFYLLITERVFDVFLDPSCPCGEHTDGDESGMTVAFS
ncbi:hypothetical protein GCM10007866_09410 [Gluconobacter albidus]|uniref:Transposase n=1 Tax=Gluconobacter albidus TaxID=318683 RepID=A0ABQ5WZQ6_9PROT|nr:hypothetical protein AA3250_2628 [Gluconobacter albidus NBRC 3250]GLQ68492.1 hypothetical protein GCM10007866_09410 [Gluconobacter albidus]